MCLGEIVRLVEVGTDGAALAQLGSRTIPVSLLTLEEQVVAGDWVVMHSGFALQRLTDDEASEALALRSTSPGSTSPGSTSPGTTSTGSTSAGSTSTGSTSPGSTPPARPGARRHELEREGPT